MPNKNKQWVKHLNKMYAENTCTCNDRVQVSFCDDLDIIIVKVFRNYEIIKIDDYTDWGLLLKIQEVVKKMYEAV